MLHRVKSRFNDLTIEVHHGVWYVPKNRGELAWLTSDLVDARKGVWAFKDGRNFLWAGQKLIQLIQSLELPGEPCLVVPVPASKIDRTKARRLDELTKLVCEKCAGLNNGSSVIQRFQDVESKHLSESRGRGLKGLYFDAASIVGADILLFDDVVTQGHTLLDLVELLLNMGAKQVMAVTLARTVPFGYTIQGGELVRVETLPRVAEGDSEFKSIPGPPPVPAFVEDDQFLTQAEEKAVLELRHGHGRYSGRHSDLGEFTYAGELSRGKPEGLGMALFDEDVKYFGYWYSGKMSGPGKMTGDKVGQVSGDWVNGCIEGYAKYRGKAGIFSGHYRKGEKVEGRVEMTNGIVFEGEIKKGKMHGLGCLTIGNGDVYKGEFQDGKFEGAGAYTAKDKATVTCQWKAGKTHGSVTVKYCDGAVWEGHHVHGVAEGAARYVSPSRRFHFTMEYQSGEASVATMTKSPTLKTGKTKKIQLRKDQSTQLWTESYRELEAQGIHMNRLLVQTVNFPSA